MHARMTCPQEVRALLLAPSLPVALLGRLRMLLADEQRASRLRPHIHLKLEEDLRDLNLCLSDCQRLFHSPIPPTSARATSTTCQPHLPLPSAPPVATRQLLELSAALMSAMMSRAVRVYLARVRRVVVAVSRHVTRCLMLWLAALPVVLSGRLPPAGVAIATALSAYIFVGMEEIGAQVEQVSCLACPERAALAPSRACLALL
jgi:predicted membrane chloride channel (bestrophin family)